MHRRSGRRTCKWKACVHVPHTTGESSPGYFPSGGHLRPVRACVTMTDRYRVSTCIVYRRLALATVPARRTDACVNRPASRGLYRCGTCTANNTRSLNVIVTIQCPASPSYVGSRLLCGVSCQQAEAQQRSSVNEPAHPSKGIRQMPQTSSPASQVQFATACQFLTVTSNTAGFALVRTMPPRAAAGVCSWLSTRCFGPAGCAYPAAVSALLTASACACLQRHTPSGAPAVWVGGRTTRDEHLRATTGWTEVITQNGGFVCQVDPCPLE